MSRRDAITRLSAEADRLLELAEHDASVSKAAIQATANDTTAQHLDKSLEEKILELHIDESLKEQWSSHVNPCSNLLSVLCRREQCNRLVLVLHPANDGYSVAVRTRDGLESEIMRFPYEEDHFLSYVNNQELPPMLLDLLEQMCSDLFYSGCIIVEIRDSRRVTPGHGTFDTCHVLLRPTTQSIICDSNLITRQGRWTPEERTALESQLVLATQEPLCLDPNPVVSVLARKADVAKHKFNTVPMRRSAKKFSQVGINRKRKLEQCAAPPELRLHDFIQTLNSRNKLNRKISPQEALAKHQTMARAQLRGTSNNQDMAQPAPTPPVAATSSDVLKFARAIPKRNEVSDMTPHIVEEYILETAERGVNRIYHTRLSIYQRLANDEYLGELYVERDYKENDNKGSTCRFVLGTRPHALRYINQFAEIFAEEGRKSVKITHRVPNQQPRVTYTPGMRAERMPAAAAAAPQSDNGPTAARVAAAAAPTPAPKPIVVAQSAIPNHQPPAQVPSGATAVVVNSVPVMVQPKKPPTVSILAQQLSSPTAIQHQLPLHPNPSVRPPLTVQVSSHQAQPPAVNLPVTPLTPGQVGRITPVAAPATPATPVTPDQAQSMLTSPQQPQQQQAPLRQDQQELAISAIMQSLMKDTAQFEADKQHHKQQLQPQLPTRPVPQASLASMTSPSNSTVKVGTSSAPPPSVVGSIHSTNNPKLIANRVSLQNLLSAQVQQIPVSSVAQGQAMAVKVTMSQLAAQLNRPVTFTTSVSLPSYTQALAQAQAQIQAQLSPRPKMVVTSQPTTLRRTSSDLTGQKQLVESPGLQALLANTPSAENPGPSTNAVAPRRPSSLLERLVTGQPITTASQLSQVARSIPNPIVVSAGQNSTNHVDSTNDITLAALLAKPTSTPSPQQQSSPTKISPLLQQLQQPIQPPRQPQQQSPRQMSPRPQQQPSPRMIQPAPSPRGPSFPPQSPQPRTVTSALQQQLMQPPKSQSILSTHLQQPLAQSIASPSPQVVSANGLIGNGAPGREAIQQQNVVNIQNLLQQAGHVVQVTSCGGSIMQPMQMNQTAVQLSIPGLSAPVTLSVNLPDGSSTSGSAQSVLLANQAQMVAAQQQKVVTSMGKLVTTAGGQQTVLYPGNIIQLPQQPTTSIANLKPITPAQLQPNQVIKSMSGSQLVQVRQQQGQQPPVFLQVPNSQNPGGQPIQLVRSISNAPPQAVVRQSPIHVLNTVNTIKSPPLMPSLSPQQQAGVPQSPQQAGTSPQQPAAAPSDPPLVAIQIQNPAEHQLLLAANQKQAQLNSQLKMRQQRKQSLK